MNCLNASIPRAGLRDEPQSAGENRSAADRALPLPSARKVKISSETDAGCCAAYPKAEPMKGRGAGCRRHRRERAIAEGGSQPAEMIRRLRIQPDEGRAQFKHAEQIQAQEKEEQDQRKNEAGRLHLKSPAEMISRRAPAQSTAPPAPKTKALRPP